MCSLQAKLCLPTLSTALVDGRLLQVLALSNLSERELLGLSDLEESTPDCTEGLTR